ncbi:MAG TPA: sulfite oxidase-like oxidoreductase [Micromonosporaceae bacterium]|jgi:DMSO/TMAO reductase YedYZ molybdopterin-dependent catalytic subunit
MAVVSRGFTGRRRAGVELPPGQYLTEDFPVLSAGPTPRVDLARWEFSIVGATTRTHSWTWDRLRALPSESVTVDLHCVTKWSKLGTGWRGVAVDTLLEDVESAADYVTVHAYGGYTTNVPLADLVDGQAWIAYEYDGRPLRPEHGGPARLLVPHLYLWKSAKWVRSFELTYDDQPGFWETAGYHNYGDPWREQRYWGD